MNHQISSKGSLLEALTKQRKGPKPDGATSLWTVRWCVVSDEFDSSFGRISSSSTPERLHNHKTFASLEKAEALKKDIEAAFMTLGYLIYGRVVLEEDWFE